MGPYLLQEPFNVHGRTRVAGAYLVRLEFDFSHPATPKRHPLSIRTR
jgi:hypothetical protein